MLRSAFSFEILFLLLIVFLSGCSGFLYQPTAYWYSDPKEHKLNYQEFSILGSDGFKLTGWHFKSDSSKKNKALVLFFHGNAQNITAHYLNFSWLPSYGHDFVIYDYRGYGISEGQANPRGLYVDVLDFLRHGHALFKQGGYQKLVVYGQSLGGAALLRAVVDFENIQDIHLMVIDSSFLSYSNVAFDKLKQNVVTWPLAPLAYFLIPDEFAPWKTLSQLKIPTLVIHGEDDAVIPFRYGQEIYQKIPLKEESRAFWKVVGGRHIDVYFSPEGKSYREKFVALLEDRLSLKESE